MIVHVDWRTVYTYSRPVHGLHSELCVMPVQRSNQRVPVGTITIDPPARLRTRVDEFGNLRHEVDFAGTTDRLAVTVRAEVETAAGPEPALDDPTWSLDRYRQRSTRAPFAPELDALFGVARAVRPLDAAAAAMAVIAGRFAYEVGVTHVADDALQLLRTGRGVCQDFTHLMLAALRRQGVAARYVSGYLAPSSGEALATASHAWVQVYHQGAWYGFDPANNTRQDERYVVTAVGRDYDDVTPVQGSYFGHAEEQWSTEVRIATPDPFGRS